MCSKTIVRLLGTILMLAGVAVIFMGVYVVTGASWINDLMPEDTTETEAVDFANDAASLGKAFEVLLFIFGIYMFVMGVMACFFCGSKCEGRCCCVILFQIFQLGLIAVTLIVAVMPFTFWMIPTEDMEWFCDSDVDSIKLEWGYNEDTEEFEAEDASPFAQIIVDGRRYVTKLDDTINTRDQIMCSSACPCDVDNWSLWQPNFDTRGLEKDDSGVDNWEECANLLQSGNDSASQQQLNAYFDGILQIFEEEFDCQGICETGRFWLFNDVDEGPVTQACLSSLKADFSSSAMASTIVLFITIVIDIMLFICMFGMMTGPKE